MNLYNGLLLTIICTARSMDDKHTYLTDNQDNTHYRITFESGYGKEEIDAAIKNKIPNANFTESTDLIYNKIENICITNYIGYDATGVYCSAILDIAKNEPANNAFVDDLLKASQPACAFSNSLSIKAIAIAILGSIIFFCCCLYCTDKIDRKRPSIRFFNNPQTKDTTNQPLLAENLPQEAELMTAANTL